MPSLTQIQGKLHPFRCENVYVRLARGHVPMHRHGPSWVVTLWFQFWSCLQVRVDS